VQETPSVSQPRQPLAEIRHAPADRDEQAARTSGHPRLDALERVRELVARGEERHPVVPRDETTGNDLVVDRRHDDLDAVIGGDAIADVEMLLEERRRRDRRPGRCGAVEQRQERRACGGCTDTLDERASREGLGPSI